MKKFIIITILIVAVVIFGLIISSNKISGTYKSKDGEVIVLKQNGKCSLTFYRKDGLIGRFYMKSLIWSEKLKTSTSCFYELKEDYIIITYKIDSTSTSIFDFSDDYSELTSQSSSKKYFKEAKYKQDEIYDDENDVTKKTDITKAGKEIKEWYTAVTTEKNTFVTVISLSYCDHCKNYKPIITEIAKNENLELYWFEIDTMKADDAEILQNTYHLENYKGSSPYSFVIKNKELLGDTIGYMDNSETMGFLRSVGAITK